jgi:transcriptional regulator with XRE-family HTH domain
MKTKSKRLCEALTIMRWSYTTLATMTDVSRATTTRWCNGEYDPPDDVLAWLEARAADLTAHPPPLQPGRWDR